MDFEWILARARKWGKTGVLGVRPGMGVFGVFGGFGGFGVFGVVGVCRVESESESGSVSEVLSDE